MMKTAATVEGYNKICLMAKTKAITKTQWVIAVV